jgi:hypothetical protein
MARIFLSVVEQNRPPTFPKHKISTINSEDSHLHTRRRENLKYHEPKVDKKMACPKYSNLRSNLAGSRWNLQTLELM